MGVLIALVGYHDMIGAQIIYIRLFLIALFLLGGVVLGRLVSSVRANRKLRRLNDLLYRQCNPAAFLDVFLPIAKNVPVQAAEHVDAQTKIAFAYEALGEMDLGLEALEHVKLSELKLHVLQCTALVANQRVRLYLLKGDADKAAEMLEELEQLQETAAGRAPTLGKQLAECVRLCTNWLKVLRDEECDLDYIREEIRLSQNDIHKSEMQLLLGYALRNEGCEMEAKESFIEAAQAAPELFAARQAKLELGLQ